MSAACLCRLRNHCASVQLITMRVACVADLLLPASDAHLLPLRHVAAGVRLYPPPLLKSQAGTLSLKRETGPDWSCPARQLNTAPI